MRTIQDSARSPGNQMDATYQTNLKWMFLFWLGTVATVLGFANLTP